MGGRAPLLSSSLLLLPFLPSCFIPSSDFSFPVQLLPFLPPFLSSFFPLSQTCFILSSPASSFPFLFLRCSLLPFPFLNHAYLLQLHLSFSSLVYLSLPPFSNPLFFSFPLQLLPFVFLSCPPFPLFQSSVLFLSFPCPLLPFPNLFFFFPLQLLPFLSSCFLIPSSSSSSFPEPFLCSSPFSLQPLLSSSLPPLFPPPLSPESQTGERFPSV